MTKNILVKFFNSGYSKDQVGFWLTDKEGFQALLALIEEYRNSDYQTNPFVYNGVKYTPDVLLYGISTINIDKEMAEFMFPYCEVLGDSILPSFISFFTLYKGVL